MLDFGIMGIALKISWIQRIQQNSDAGWKAILGSMKGVDSIPFDDTKAVIHIAFPYFGLYFRGVNSFHTTLNSIDPHISFTIEEESDQQIAFLDTLVSRKDNKITINVYRKATHTDRYLDFSSHHDKRHKISTGETLLHRAINLPNTSQGKNTEINHVTDALRVNNYPSYVVSNILKRKFSKPPALAIPTPEELVCMFF